MNAPRDHGGGLDAAMARFGGSRDQWIDLSTGINPVPYPLPPLPSDVWTRLPDSAAMAACFAAARAFWQVPAGLGIAVAPGASSLIARMPALAPPGDVWIPGPTYNEHAAAFRAAGRRVTEDPDAPVRVVVHPNNPDGRLWSAGTIAGGFAIIDESFGEVAPETSLLGRVSGAVVLKSFGKFWGLAGLRLGFLIAPPELVARMEDLIGPWPVSGPALAIATAALSDTAWTAATRARLAGDADRLDALMTAKGAELVGGTNLFRLYAVDDAQAWQARLAASRIWTRTFPYDRRWIRLGLPAPADWPRIEASA